MEEQNSANKTALLEKERARRLAALDEYRNSIAADKRQSQDAFDQAIMTLAASGIGVTLAFLDKIIPFTAAVAKGSLFLVWIYWGLTLASALCSFFSSTKALSIAEGKVGEEWLLVRDTANPNNVPSSQMENAWDRATKIFNLSSAGLFIAGFVALIVFLWFNLVQMPNPKPSPQRTNINEGGPVGKASPATGPNPNFASPASKPASVPLTNARVISAPGPQTGPSAPIEKPAPQQPPPANPAKDQK